MDPLCEETHADLIRLHAASGRRTDALRLFQDLELKLRRDLGVEPAAATRELIRAIERGVSLPRTAAQDFTGPWPAPAPRAAPAPQMVGYE